MTREEYLKTVEAVPEGEREKLISIFDENEKLKGIKDDAFKERDDYKKKLKALEDAKAAAEAKAAEEQGEYKKLYETEKLKAETVSKQLETFKPFKEKYDKVETERRTELIDQLDDDELKAHAKKYEKLEDLQEYISLTLKKLGSGKKTVDGGRGGKSNFDGVTSWEELKTQKEKDELKKANPALYIKLWNKKYPLSPITSVN